MSLQPAGSSARERPDDADRARLSGSRRPARPLTPVQVRLHAIQMFCYYAQKKCFQIVRIHLFKTTYFLTIEIITLYFILAGILYTLGHTAPCSLGKVSRESRTPSLTCGQTLTTPTTSGHSSTTSPSSCSPSRAPPTLSATPHTSSGRECDVIITSVRVQ